MLDFDIITVILSGVILLLILIILKYKYQRNTIYLLFFTIFYIYLVNVLKYTIFPIPLDPFMAKVMSEGRNFTDGINLLPFNFPSIEYFLHKQVPLNVILSIPFGFGISYILKMSKKKLVVSSILFGLIIELAQLVISLFLSFTYRYIDINDVILNGLGIYIGYFLFRVFSCLYVYWVKKYNIKLNPLLKFLYTVSTTKF